MGIDEGVHEVDALKPIATPAEQVEMLKAKGVTFEQCSEERAMEVLSEHETYLHLTAYRVPFQRHTDGPAEGKPVWVLLEVVPFGTLLAVYLFCVARWGESDHRELHYALKDVKAIRNCASHGGCLINGFVSADEAKHVTSGVTIDWLNEHGIKNSKGRRARLRNRRVQQLVTTVALYNTIVGRGGKEEISAVRALKSSLAERVERYGSQNTFVSCLAFLAKVLDAATV